MPDLSLDLRHLRYVLAVVEQGSFRRAALSLDLPQSTISRRVQMLERRLGISIFDRDHKGVHLTAAGQRFVNEADFTNAVGALHAVRRGQGGAVRLGMFTSLRNEFLRRPVGEYHLRHPAIECHFEEGTTQSSIGGVIDGRLDIAFVTGRPTAPGCQSVALGQEQLYVAERRQDLVRPTEAMIPLSSLRDRRFIVTRGGRGSDVEEFILSQLISPGFRPDVQVHDVQLRDSSSHSGAWFWRGRRVRDRDSTGRCDRMSSAGWGMCLGAKAGPRRGRAVDTAKLR